MTSQPNAFARTVDFEFTALNEAKNYRLALLREFQSHLQGNVLEVGAGIGQISCELLKIPAIERLLVIEPDAGHCARIRESFPQVDLLQGTVSDLKAGTNWDAILSINVLEHIEQDEDELARYHELLRPSGGALCLLVPARPEIYAPIDRDFGHFRRYTRTELGGQIRRAGFRIHRLRYYNLVGYFAWWASFCLLKRRSFDSSAVRLFDRAIFPFSHGIESRICPPPIGQSLMAVAVAV